MTLPRLGHAVIVKNITSELPGSKVDVEALRDAYDTVGFEVQVHEDCSIQVKSSEEKTKKAHVKDINNSRQIIAKVLCITFEVKEKVNIHIKQHPTFKISCFYFSK